MTPHIAPRDRDREEKRKEEEREKKPLARHRQLDRDFLHSAAFRDLPLDVQIDTILNPGQTARDIVIYTITGRSITGKRIDGSKEHEIVRNALARGLRNHYAQTQHMVDLALRRLHTEFSETGRSFGAEHYVQPIPDKFSRLEFITRGIDSHHVKSWWWKDGRPITLRQIIPAGNPALKGTEPRETFDERFYELRDALAQGRAGKKYGPLADSQLTMTGHALSEPSLVTYAQVPGTRIEFPRGLPGRAFVRLKQPETLWNKIMREISERLSKDGVQRPGAEDAAMLFDRIRVFDIAAANMILYGPLLNAESAVGRVVKFLKTDPKFRRHYPWPGVYTHQKASIFEQNDYNKGLVPQGRVKLVLGTNELPHNAAKYGIAYNVNLRTELNITDVTSQLTFDVTGPTSHEDWEKYRNKYYRDEEGREHKYSPYYEGRNIFFQEKFEEQFGLRGR